MEERKEHRPEKRGLFLHDFKIAVENTSGESSLLCAFLGPPGTYTEQAASELLQNQVNLRSSISITDVFRSVDNGKLDIGLVPIENSTEGNVIETIRGIIRSNLMILGEKILPIHHVLFGDEKVLSKAIVHSHPQAIGQCTNWLEQNLPGAKIVAHNSTAEAVQIAAEREELAIGNSVAGKLYGIQTLKERIEDFKENTTHFWLLGRGETNPTGKDRTTLLFSLRNRTGLLRNSLAIFADRRINITKIDSFPIGALDEYYFLLSLDGHQNEPFIAEALEEFRKTCLRVRILGSYHKAPIPQKFFEPNAIINGWITLEDTI